MVKQKKSKSKTKFEEYNKNFAETAVGINNTRLNVFAIFFLFLLVFPLIIIGIIGIIIGRDDNALSIGLLSLGIFFLLIFILTYYRNKQNFKRVKKDKDYAVRYGVSNQTNYGYGYYY